MCFYNLPKETSTQDIHQNQSLLQYYGCNCAGWSESISILTCQFWLFDFKNYYPRLMDMRLELLQCCSIHVSCKY